MRVAKWGNSLAIRLPAAVTQALALKEGDQIEVNIIDRGRFEIAHDRSRERAIERLRSLRRPLPPGFHFDRGEANAR
ncbi:MAG TPA: AbrB/MazE/SpoVT family DNA-binding domain-containing protein [Acidobacteriaceae bacterium]|jgi:antitoxin MazE|nr:AbrB/MazE/SpoVT family DNA-binding domain-containing protein [Acidobacteriaceae bacterium]